MKRLKSGQPAPMSAEGLKYAMEANQLPPTATEQAIGGRAANGTVNPGEVSPTRKPEKRKTTKRKTKPDQAKSQELPGMPALDPVAKAARRYLKSVDAARVATENKGECGNELLKAMITAKKESILIDGHRIHWKHVDAKDSITVEKPK